MALSRKMLEEMGLEDTQISAIINAHRETVDGLKNEITTYTKQIEGLEEDKKSLSSESSDWKKKFEDEHSDFEDYKQKQADKDVTATKEKAYAKLLKEAGISEKRIASILKVTDMKTLELKDGKFTNADELTESIKDEWADFIVKEEVKGADTPKPIGNTGGNVKTKEEINAIKDTAERQKAMAENASLYGIE